MTSFGLIAPPTNTVNEAEWERMAPPDLALRVARMPLHTDTESEAGRSALREDLRSALRELRGCDLMVYGCTAGSMVLPLDSLTAFMQELAGVPAVATAPALVHACRALGLSRVALATPYHDSLNAHEVGFFAAARIETVSVRGLGIGAGGAHEYVRIARVPPEQVYAHCRATDVPAAQGLVVSCTDFRTLEVLPRLEAELGKPVLSSNLATFWMALRTAGRNERIAGFGRLLER
ncbi:MAG TPA: decarboxylase [Burkholderiales bacterium]|nr:decarboxylase [Burkholderiales bacterium]